MSALTHSLLVALLAGGLAAGPPSATSSPLDELDDLSDSALRSSITSLDPRISPLDPRIQHLEPRITPLDTRTTEGEETVISLASDILFEFGESDVDARAEAKVVELVQDVPDGATVQVHGHTDSISGKELNQQLSEDRAATIAAIIEEARPDLQLEVEGFGMDRPVEPNEVDGEDNPEGRALNRRVEIRYDG